MKTLDSDDLYAIAEKIGEAATHLNSAFVVLKSLRDTLLDHASERYAYEQERSRYHAELQALKRKTTTTPDGSLEPF